jgi:enoyl-CoA hydratase/carnithine racemase
MKALSTSLREGVLYVTLDTPACSVNIFTHAAALELLSILENLDPAARALVFRSAKPHSFVNGASLMLASAVSKPEDLPRLTAPIRRAYDALGALPIPTLAAVRGSCYGCGVELTLRCRFRVAGDSHDAQFYMTEVADYLLVPTFGSTQYLPHVLGLEAATDFLLWGERWSGSEALSRGLVSGCLPDSEFDFAVERIATDLARRGESPLLRSSVPRAATDVRALGARTRERIRHLPPAYRGVYETCYSLMEQAALKRTLDAAGFQDEVMASGRSIMAPISKASVAFFFVRQLNEQVVTRGTEDQSTFRVACDTSAEPVRFLRQQLESRKIRGVSFAEFAGARADSATCSIMAYPQARADRTCFAFSADLELDEPESSAEVILYAPTWRRGTPFVEIASSTPSDKTATAFRLFAKAGVAAVVTQPRTGFVTNDLLCAFLRPQVAFVKSGGSPGELAATLSQLGFTRLPGDWLPGWDLSKLARLLHGGGSSPESIGAIQAALGALPCARAADGAAPSGPVESAILVSLLSFARRALADGCAKHPSVLDVVAREVIDFPIGSTSLCRYLTVERARQLGERETEVAALVSDDELDALKDFIGQRRDFYR